MTLEELEKWCSENDFKPGNSVEYLIATLFHNGLTDSTVVRNLIEEKRINWEQRQFELVKAIAQGIFSDSTKAEYYAEAVKIINKNCGDNLTVADFYAKEIVGFADIILKKYKETLEDKQK